MTPLRDLRPRIAVVIPCYNDGETLGETLASVLSQEACEVVVVDDGSDDPHTVRVVSNLADSRVRVVHQQNSGLSKARNAGVHATDAPYIFPLDADDLVTEGSLAALADVLDANPRAMLAWGDVVTFGDFRARWNSPKTLDPWRITYLNEIPVASMVRRDALRATGGWQAERYEDWDLWMSFAERGWTGAYLPRVVLRYRVRRSRMWRTEYVPRHDELYAELQMRHESLFANRRLHWRRSPAPLRLKLLLPLISRLPLLSPYTRFRLSYLVSRPRSFLRRADDGWGARRLPRSAYGKVGPR